MRRLDGARATIRYRAPGTLRNAAPPETAGTGAATGALNPIA